MTDKPHDALFKASATPDAGLALVRAVCPPEVAQAFEGATFRMAPNDFKEEALGDRFGDVLFEVTLADAKEALVYVMVEHQSTVDSFMALRVLRYMVRIWSQWEKLAETRPKAIPPILPIVLYHGKQEWSAARSFQDLVDLPASMTGVRHLIPSFEYLLDDLRQVSDQELLARQAPPFATVSWVLLRHNYDDERGAEVLRVCEEQIRAMVAAGSGRLESLEQLAAYMLLGDFGTPEELAAELGRIGGPRAEEVAVTAGEQLLEQGRQEGEATGVLKGERRILLRILSRLGTVTPEINARVQAAGEADLERWAEVALSANSIEDVFED